ncbi:hypothetical protein PHLCEN_2v10643 [Hermanssonia centrifuga]|uniref:Uncharacterized protein n=1 Tax=Hermanssonia centrifuga TaxID=98765 RepID=A0A2R6NMC3_9APHY|nr:hypothetical protein PHLCEN_2v10643 [Hermanssonia centrifuga]
MQGLMSTIDERTSLGKVVGYTLICGLGFGAGTQTSMIIPQVGLSEDLLPTVTAFISATPNLGGVLGVGIIGTVINSEFRSSVSDLLGPEDVPQHINDAVTAAMDPITGPEVITAYIGAFRLGFRILAGIAAFQFVLCLALGKVVLSGGKPEILDVSPTEDKVALERPGTVTQTEKDVRIEEVTRET